jgi:hypothetical protein
MFYRDYHRARVSEGAALLDQHLPDWYKYIDTDHLHLWDGDACVLGQLAHRHPRFSYARNSVWSTADYLTAGTWLRSRMMHRDWKLRDYGFSARSMLMRLSYIFLRHLWTAEVQVRKDRDTELELQRYYAMQAMREAKRNSLLYSVS